MRSLLHHAGLGLTLATLAALTGCLEEPTGPGPQPPPPPPPPVAVVVVSPDAQSIVVGNTLQLSAVARSAAGDSLPGIALTWTTENATVATVSPTGLVTGLRAGSTRITATSGTRSGFVTVGVVELNPAPAIGSIQPAQAAVGGPDLLLTIHGTGFRPDVRLHWNGVVRPTAYVSPTELRATIWAGDLAQEGTARIQVINPAPGGGPSAQVSFPIVPQLVPVGSVELSQSIALTTQGLAVPLTVTIRDAGGNVLTDRLVTWTSSNHLVATVNGAGIVQPTSVGEATITATSEGRTATLALSVGNRTTHLVMDDAASGLAVVDMRRGGAPVRFWETGPATKLAEPSVSPDGRYVAYTLEQLGSRSVAVMDQATRTYVFLSGDGTSDQPAWSPVGNRIAFRSSRAGRPDIWVINADGTGAVNLTATLPDGWRSEQPAWSPDGTRLVFSAGSAGPVQLFTMKPDGTSLQPLLFSTADDTEASWKFDAVVFTRRQADGTSDLYRVAVGGGPVIQLTHTGQASSPAWSPDGRWIAFADGPAVNGRRNIMAVRPFGEEVRPLSLRTTPEGGGRNPAWLTHN